ncbi:MAG: hypothetical protein B6242_09560 [Anaerolineaceae bacterium 4572_78]|nr:MAG: hypothetical protein B6242_09560 [Anaerolineaceae bacterium 4572_78]
MSIHQIFPDTRKYTFGKAGLPIFILTAPALAISLLSNNPLQQELETWHYAAPMLPFIMLAVVDGMRRLEKLHLNHFYAHGRNKKWGDKNQISIMLTIILLCSSFTYHYFRGYSPLSKPFHLPNVTQHHAIGDEIAATIPQSASVMAQAELVPHISQREHVSIWTGDFSSDIDYIFFDISHPKFINADNAQTNLISTMIYESNFGLMVSRDGYLLLKREATRKPTQDGFQDFLFADNQQAQSKFVPAKFGDILSLVGMDVHVNRKEEAEVSLYFHVLQQPNDDYFIHLYLLDDMGHVKGATVFQQPVLVWWPTHLWQAGQIIKVRFNTLSWWTADRTDVFSYAVGISYEADPWDVDSRLHVVCQRTNRILILHEQEKKPCLILADNLVYLQDFKRMACMVYAVKGNDENNR